MGRRKKIIENATITYKNGAKQLYDAIVITDTGIYIGCMRRSNTTHKEFEDHGFVPRDQIQRITICSEQGMLRVIDM